MSGTRFEVLTLSAQAMSWGMAEEAFVVCGKAAGVAEAMVEEGFQDGFSRGPAVKRAANGIQSQGMQIIPGTFVEGRTESIFEFAPAHPEGEAEIGNPQRLGQMIPHPSLGAMGEAGAIAEGILPGIPLIAEFPCSGR